MGSLREWRKEEGGTSQTSFGLLVATLFNKKGRRVLSKVKQRDERCDLPLACKIKSSIFEPTPVEKRSNAPRGRRRKWRPLIGCRCCLDSLCPRRSSTSLLAISSHLGSDRIRAPPAPPTPHPLLASSDIYIRELYWSRAPAGCAAK